MNFTRPSIEKEQRILLQACLLLAMASSALQDGATGIKMKVDSNSKNVSSFAGR